MKKRINRVLLIALTVSMMMVSSVYATPTLDYYTGNAADAVYTDTGAELGC